MGCFVKLLPTLKIDEFSLCFIQFKSNGYYPGLDVLHGSPMIAVLSSSDDALLSLLVFLFYGLKVFLIEWSSAKPFRDGDSGTISDSVEA